MLSGAADIDDALDPLDGPGWRRAVEDLSAPGSGLRAALARRTAEAGLPSWTGHFVTVEDALGRTICRPDD